MSDRIVFHRYWLWPFMAVVLLATSIVPVSGQGERATRIVVIQLKTVYEGYWKYKQVRELLESRRVQLESSEAELDAALREGLARLQQLQLEASSPALSQAARSEKAQDVGELRQKLQILEAEKTQKRRALVQFGQSEREHLLGEIMSMLRDYSQRHGYDLVLDNSAAASNMPAPILYAAVEMDISEHFLREINKGHEAADGAVKPGTPLPELKESAGAEQGAK